MWFVPQTLSSACRDMFLIREGMGLSIYYIISDNEGWVREKIMSVKHCGGRGYISYYIIVARGFSKR